MHDTDDAPTAQTAITQKILLRKSIAMKLDVDTQQRLKTAAGFVLEFYKIAMGTFLTVFVPRSCSDGACTITENIYDNGLYHQVALGFNALAFIFFLNLYRVELQRENWCIKYLDIDPDKANENLDDEIEEYPELKKQMSTLNQSYKTSTVACTALQVMNIGVSLGDIADNWAGSASMTPMLSYILLVVMKLYSAYFVSTEAIKTERAYSAYLSGPKTYNTIDKDHRKDADKPVEASDVTVEEIVETGRERLDSVQVTSADNAI